MTTTNVTPGWSQQLALLYHEAAEVMERADPAVRNWIRVALTGRQFAYGIDLGCGSGRYTRMMAQHCSAVVGIDTSETMLDLAVSLCRDEHYNITWVRTPILAVDGRPIQLSEASAPFNLVVSVWALHHAGDPDKVLSHVANLVAPGGTLLVVDGVNRGGWEQPEYHRLRGERLVRFVAATGAPKADVEVVRQLWTSPEWLAMIREHTPMTINEFTWRYQQQFPGCVPYDFSERDCYGILWHRPPSGEATAP